MKRVLLSTFICFLISIVATAQYNATVAQDGSGNYTTVQAAINAAPTNSTTAWVIFIKNGKYYEKVNVPSNKPNLQLIGESVANVIVYYDDYAGKPITGGGTLGTGGSASVTISAADFTAMNITFANTFKYDSAAAAGVSGTQAVAISINGDRSAFKNCRFIGMQDTMYTKGARLYFLKCYIDGIVDFIFGSSIAIFDSCNIYPKSRQASGNSYITAANTAIGSTYGYLLKDCNIYNNTGTTLYYLGRPWNNATAGNTAENKVVLMNTKMSANINPLGWSIWDAGTIISMITNAEYKSKKFDGTLVDISNRVSWSKQFTNTDTVGYNTLNMFNGWNPCSVRTDFCNYTAPEIAVSNFKGTKSGNNTNFIWNISFPVTGITYDLYRSIDNKVSYQILSSSTAANDTSINFSGVDAVPPSCSSYFYFIKASKTGYETTFTDTIEVSSIPTVNTTINSLTNFLQGSTAPSASQAFIVNGVNLLNNITITAPTNFEISLDNTNWNVNPITLTQSSGSIANTTIYVRLNAATANSYSGNIVFTTNCTSSTITKNIAVSGVTQSTPLQNYNVIQQWNLTADNKDDSTVRAGGVAATRPSFNKLFLSNGTQVPTIPSYSVQFGQAFSASTTGDGTWSTASGGPGSNLNRTFYEEFTIKPEYIVPPCCSSATYALIRVDSLLINTAFYNTSSGIKLAVVYSKSNFTTDSANVTGGRDGAGLSLTASANGGFTTPIVLANQSGGPTAQYALALNGGTGIEITDTAGIKIRLYYACGSGNPGRYAMLKNVQIKGSVTQILPLKFTNYTINLKNKNQVENIWLTNNEINVSHFDIQRSNNGKDFVTIGKVNANNNSINEYSFIDNNVVDGKNYYRIIAVDKDGKTTTSQTKLFTINYKLSTINIYPNPATSIVNIECEDARQLLIIDGLGKTIYQSNSISKHLIIDTKKFAKGIYNFQMITIEGAMINQKLIIQ